MGFRRPTPTRRVRILLRVAFYGLAVFGGLPLAFSQVLVGTVRQPTHPPPPGVEEIPVVSEGLRLRAWLLPGDPGRPAAVVAHGLGDSLESYLAVGLTLQARGYTTLLLDLRGHGGSQGRHTTLGGREREDVRAAIQELARRGWASRGVLLFGYSMGAVAALRAAAGRSDVRAVVVEAPFDSYRAAVARAAGLYYHLPAWPLAPLSIAVAEWRAGFDADEVDAVAAAREVRAPLLAIADAEDPRAPVATVQRVFDAHPGPGQLWLAPAAPHVGAVLSPDYWPRVLGFLQAQGL